MNIELMLSAITHVVYGQLRRLTSHDTATMTVTAAPSRWSRCCGSSRPASLLR